MTQNEDDKNHVEAVQYLLHYAIKGRIHELHSDGSLPSLMVVNQVTAEVCDKAVKAGLLEEDDD